jgi:hypothetical protein
MRGILRTRTEGLRCEFTALGAIRRPTVEAWPCACGTSRGKCSQRRDCRSRWHASRCIKASSAVSYPFACPLCEIQSAFASVCGAFLCARCCQLVMFCNDWLSSTRLVSASACKSRTFPLMTLSSCSQTKAFLLTCFVTLIPPQFAIPFVLCRAVLSEGIVRNVVT